jgi:hypothetical protein
MPLSSRFGVIVFRDRVENIFEIRKIVSGSSNIFVRWQERLVFVKMTLVNAHPGKLAKFVEI